MDFQFKKNDVVINDMFQIIKILNITKTYIKVLDLKTNKEEIIKDYKDLKFKSAESDCFKWRWWYENRTEKRIVTNTDGTPLCYNYKGFYNYISNGNRGFKKPFFYRPAYEYGFFN